MESYEDVPLASLKLTPPPGEQMKELRPRVLRGREGRSRQLRHRAPLVSGRRGTRLVCRRKEARAMLSAGVARRETGSLSGGRYPERDGPTRPPARARSTSRARPLEAEMTALPRRRSDRARVSEAQPPALLRRRDHSDTGRGYSSSPRSKPRSFARFRMASSCALSMVGLRLRTHR